MSKIFLFVLVLSGFFINEISSLNQSDEFLRPSSFEKIAEIDQAILCETQQIQDLQSIYGVADEVLWLYNQLGISYFFRGEYLSALDKFDYILQQKSHDEESLLIGAALWGKAICHACLDMSDEMVQDIHVLESYFHGLFHYNCRSPREKKRLVFSDEQNHYSNWIMVTKQVQFANPNENISAA